MSLKPWRQVAIPHGDVSAGRYQQAEFAADLAQVLHGRADVEYQDPSEFFARTFVTQGMRNLLVIALQRVAGLGGEPVVKLKTSFGGGKTHTMLALYHLLGGGNARNLHGVPDLLRVANVGKVPKCRLAVLVGTALEPTKPRKNEHLKGSVRTLWGEMAAQIGGRDHAREAYQLVVEADQKGVAPGSDTMLELFETFGPCVVLIDELVAYARNIYGVTGLPAGSFDSNMTFVHNLTEAARRSKSSMVVASLPASDIEIGGEGGQAALERLENTFGRLESVWQPVGHLESFEIVRRRIFSRMEDEAARDATCAAFHQMYKEQSGDFPVVCKDKEYLDRLRAAYPVHPEFFDRLYEDWATLERFQRTRGVLRLMAAVVHELWTQNEQSPLIMPGNLPLYAPKVRDELTRYLGDQWSIIVDTDVDGTESGPSRVDRDNARFGRLSAGRRVARTIFLGSAPSVRQQRVRGIEDVRIRLGVVQPGENLSIFADALSRLTEKLTYLYHDNQRYWYDLRPTLRRTVEDRAAQWDPVDIENELIARLQRLRDRHDFRAVHVTSNPSEIPDEQEARLVVLGPADVHRRGGEYPARVKAQEILDSKGTGPRLYKNMLIFLAPDDTGIRSCLQSIRLLKAWQSVLDDEEQLGLDAVQRRQAKDGLERADRTVDAQIGEAYCWVHVPHQEVSAEEGPKEIQWEIARLSGGQGGVLARVNYKVTKDQQLITAWSPLPLKLELDRWLWKTADHISLSKLWDYLTTYLYLPRLAKEGVLIEAIREGLRSKDFFAYASGQDPRGRYLGLTWNCHDVRVLVDGNSLLVKPEVAADLIEPGGGIEEAGTLAEEVGTDEAATGAVSGDTSGGYGQGLPTRFHGSVALDPTRVARDAGRIAEEVLAHLVALPESQVEVDLEIRARIPEGAPEPVVRTVSENAKTLKFRSGSGFEEE